MEQQSNVCRKVDGLSCCRRQLHAPCRDACPSGVEGLCLGAESSPQEGEAAIVFETTTTLSGLLEAASSSAFELLRKQGDSPDACTRRRRELLLDNTESLQSLLQARRFGPNPQVCEDTDTDSVFSATSDWESDC